MTRIVIFGFGAVGKAAAEQAVQRGHEVTVAQRSAPNDLPAGAKFVSCDVTDVEAVRRAAAAANAEQIVLAVGFAYTGAVWREVWPKTMHAVLTVCAERRARLVFVDNLYMYGPQTAPLREDMPLTDHGAKPAARAAITRLWMAEAQAGRVKTAALRAPDFYGPGVTLSHLGATGLAAIAAGKAATMIVPPDMPHAYAYVPDFGRGVVTLLEAPDDCFGQAWHLPCPPVRTSRELLAMGAAALGRKPQISALPFAVQGVAGLFVPMLREMAEMRFQWDRPYTVDWSKWAGRFWSDATPHEVGVPAAVRSFAGEKVAA
ncbi:MAG: NAD-dependent epimerase/dehydratase family protein [Alphaproteobacteria bacterium]|nr:NAD-dependent epimerase/dehydratase family protein [Alphaproteobacteria bacterium]